MRIDANPSSIGRGPVDGTFALGVLVPGAALAFLRLPSTEPELNLLHRVFDSWSGLGLITVAVERQGMRLSLSPIAEGEWRATFQSNAMFAPEGFGDVIL
jgi:hypothetical protein